MKKILLIESLKALDSKHLKEFQDFVASPFFNKHKETIKLTNFLVKYHPTFNLSKETIRKLFYKNTKISDQQLRDALSSVMKLLNAFFTQKGMEQSLGFDKLFNLQFCKNERIELNYKRNVVRFIKEWNSKNELGFNAQLVDFLLSEQQDQFYAEVRSLSNKDFLKKTAKKFDHLFIAQKIRTACQLKNWQNVVEDEVEIHLLEAVLNYVETNQSTLREVPEVWIYYTIYNTLHFPGNRMHFDELLQLLKIHSPQFQISEAQDLYRYAQNYCIKKINFGEAEFLNDLFLIYKDQLQLGLLLEKNKLSQWHYKNIVTVACRLKAHDWANEFIHQYQNKLPQEEQKAAYDFNLAALHYSMGAYEKVFEGIRSLQFKDVYYQLDARALLLKVYFETKEFEALYYLLNAFSVFLQRNKTLSGYQRVANKNLIRLAKKMSKIQEEFQVNTKEANHTKLKNLIQKINATNPLTNANWLREQCDMMIHNI